MVCLQCTGLKYKSNSTVSSRSIHTSLLKRQSRTLSPPVKAPLGRISSLPRALGTVHKSGKVRLARPLVERSTSFHLVETRFSKTRETNIPSRRLPSRPLQELDIRKFPGYVTVASRSRSEPRVLNTLWISSSKSTRKTWMPSCVEKSLKASTKSFTIYNDPYEYETILPASLSISAELQLEDKENINYVTI